MERKSILHEQVVIPTRRASTFPSTLTLALQNLQGEVSCYAVSGEQATSLGMMAAHLQSFCVFQQQLVMLDRNGQVGFRDITAQRSNDHDDSFDSIHAVAANSDYLALLTADRQVLLIDSHRQTRRTMGFVHPARDISLGEENTLWIAGGEEVLGGYPVYWSTDYETFNQIPWPASAVSLYGDRSGIAWTINSRQEVWKLHRLGEGNMPGCRQDTGCRNCMFKTYRGAIQIAAPEGLFLVLHHDNVLRGYPFAGASDPILEWRDVARFRIGFGPT
jgi:hypothetical protein